MLLVYVVVLVYVALNLHKFYLNKHTVVQFAVFGQRFCLGDLHILIIQLRCLSFNCSRARHYIPYSPYPFPTDGNLAQVFFIFCNLLLVFYFFCTNNTASKSLYHFLRHKVHSPVVEKMLRLSTPGQMQVLSLHHMQNTQLNATNHAKNTPRGVLPGRSFQSACRDKPVG